MLIPLDFFLFLGIGLFGAMSLSMYFLLAAHINDRVDPDKMIEASLSLTFYWSIGAIVGPLLSAWMMTIFTYYAFVFFIIITHGGLTIYTLYRMMVRKEGNQPIEDDRFVDKIQVSYQKIVLYGKSKGWF